MKNIRKILVANRAEIAIRVMRTAREMGIATVAVYSEADRGALHTRYADEAVYIGPTPSAQSYLVMEKIIGAALSTGADAIHPGYGFLSENAVFAQKVKDAGLIFIGPAAESIQVMGSKLGAKEAVAKYDIPRVPGTPGAISDPDEALVIAEKIGFPVLIKASAGGGGKGMRAVYQASELKEQMAMAISEAQAAFGDGAVFIEKYILNPKHIEVQILGDQHGNVVYLYERECSVQRRHQKLIEEAPSAVLTPEKRKAMGEAAVLVAKACNYFSTGTVEFVVDEELNFYFLEMNTRLQVEHPVTEMITGLDLVEQQIRVAQGEPLAFEQDDIMLNGHSIEVRVCAEDPAQNFMPDTGILKAYRRPQGPGVRVDDGFEQGQEIPVFYDPMIAKLIVHAADRESAIERLHRAIEEYQIIGIQTTLGFCNWALAHPEFESGKYDTGFISKYFKPEFLKVELNEEEALAAAFVSAMALEGGGLSQTSTNPSMAVEAPINGLAAWRKS